MALVVKKKAAPQTSQVDMQEAAESTAPLKPISKNGLAKPPVSDLGIPDEAGSTGGAAIGTITKQHSDGSSEQTQEVLKEVHLQEAPAYVTFSCGLTKNLGDYNSLRFNVGITIPCNADADAIDEAYEEGKAWVDDKINAINEEVDQQLGE